MTHQGTYIQFSLDQLQRGPDVFQEKQQHRPFKQVHQSNMFTFEQIKSGDVIIEHNKKV